MVLGCLFYLMRLYNFDVYKITQLSKCENSAEKMVVLDQRKQPRLHHSQFVG